MKRIWPPLLAFALPVMSQLETIDTLINDNLTSAYGGKVCAMILHEDSLVYYKAVGGFDSSSVEQIASGTKTFSGVLMLKLAQEGFFSLDDSIGGYIPYATAMGKGAGTIRQNFSHTGGWDGSEGEAYLNKRSMGLAEAVDSIIRFDPMIYTPGDSFKYTGVAMQVAARCAEVAAGRPWIDLFNDYLKAPLGLSNTRYCTASDANPRIAGGICTSPADILRLVRFILKDGKTGDSSLIDSAWMRELWTDQTRRAPQISSPYPNAPGYNNPYGADTIYYGIGDWLDIANPVTGIQEQISGAGAFGTIFWVNRCTRTAGVVFTLRTYLSVMNTTFRIIDAANAAFPGECGGNTRAGAPLAATKSGLAVSSALPNPFSPRTRLNAVLPSRGSYKLSVYSPSGRLVRSFKGKRGAGPLSVDWDGLDATGKPVAAGVYCCVLEHDGARAARSLFKVK